MGTPTVMYSASHPDGRLFDSDDVPTLGPEWVDHPDKVAEDAQPDLSASDDQLYSWTKEELESAAREQLGIELDRRKSKKSLIGEIREAQNGNSG